MFRRVDRRCNLATGDLEMVNDSPSLYGWVIYLCFLCRIFYINLPVCIPTMLIVYFSLHQKSNSNFSLEKIKSFDWAGMVILTGALVGVLYGVTGGGVIYSWSSAQILSALIIGIFGIALTIFYEGFVAKAPMIPPWIFRSRTASLGYFITWCQAVTLWAYAYFITLYVSSSIHCETCH
jgi:hypothetical protein